MLTKFCRISAPGTGAVKEPLGVDERSPEQGGCLRSEVLVSDLLSSPDPRLGSDLDPVVCHHHGLGVVSTSLGYFASILQHKQTLEKQGGEGGASDHKLK